MRVCGVPPAGTGGLSLCGPFNPWPLCRQRHGSVNAGEKAILAVGMSVAVRFGEHQGRPFPAQGQARRPPHPSSRRAGGTRGAVCVLPSSAWARLGSAGGFAASQIFTRWGMKGAGLWYHARSVPV